MCALGDLLWVRPLDCETWGLCIACTPTVDVYLLRKDDVFRVDESSGFHTRQSLVRIAIVVCN